MAQQSTKSALCFRFRGAFTLTELLVVLGILAVLVAVLLPVFFAGRAKARTAACSANLRQIGNALQGYLQDYDGVYPPDTQVVFTDGTAVSTPSNDHLNWCDLLAAYTGGTFPACPDYSLPPSWAKKIAGKPQSCGYSYNAYLSEAVALTKNQKTSAGLAENVVRNPSLLTAVFDGRAPLISYVGPDINDHLDDAEQGPPGATRHQGGANYLFADGHVKWFKPDGLSMGDKGDGIHPGFGL